MNMWCWTIIAYLSIVSGSYFLIKAKIKQKRQIEKKEIFFDTTCMLIPGFNIIFMMNLAITLVEEPIKNYMEKLKQEKEKKKEIRKRTKQKSFLGHFYGVEEKEIFGETYFEVKREGKK